MMLKFVTCKLPEVIIIISYLNSTFVIFIFSVILLGT